MKEEKLFELLKDIDEKYISEAMIPNKRKTHYRWIKWAAAAACLCLVVGTAALIPYFRSEPGTADSVQEFNTDGSEEEKAAAAGNDVTAETYAAADEAQLKPEDASGTAEEQTSGNLSDTAKSEERGIKNNTDLSAEIVDKACAGSKGNVVFSPLSLNMALGMLSEGAGGETKSQLDSYLGTTDYSRISKLYLNSDIQENSETGTSLLTDLEPSYGTLSINNSIWFRDTFDIKEDYIKTLKNNYAAEVTSADFSDASGTAEKINTWTNDKTNGRISRIIEASGITEETEALLVNTVYMKSSWCEPLTVSGKSAFTKTDGSAVDAEYVQGGADVYYSNDKAAAFGKYYMNGLQFIGILPDKEGDFSVEELDIAGLIGGSDTSYDEINIKMPKVHAEAAFDRLDVWLKELGLTDLFTQAADLSGISDSDIEVSSVIQKTYMDIDENGTEAAAATAVMMTTSAPAQERKTIEITLDRPYAFVIYDSSTQQIVFIGKITEP